MQLDFFNDKPLSNSYGSEKVCNTCKKLKPLTSYSRAAGGNHVRPDCKDCSNHAQRVRETLKRQIPYPDEKHMCPVCNKREGEVKWKTQKNRRVWCLDHDHKTDKFRGWICFRCNIAVGQVKDCSDTAYRLYEYLKAYKETR
jgi:hypothetical protein